MFTTISDCTSNRSATAPLLLALLLFAGCSTTPMSAEDKEYRYFQVYEQWNVCQQAYTQSRASWVSHLSTVKVRMGDQMLPLFHDMRRDMVANKCATVLRQVGYSE